MAAQVRGGGGRSPSAQPQNAPIHPEAPNPLDYDEKVHRFVRVCDELGLSVDNAHDLLSCLKRLLVQGLDLESAVLLAGELRKAKRSPAEAARYLSRSLAAGLELEPAVAEESRRLEALHAKCVEAEQQLKELQAEAKALGWSKETIRTLSETDAQLRAGNATPEQVALFSHHAGLLAKSLNCSLPVRA